MDAGVREGKYYQFGAFVLDPTRRVLSLDGAPVALSSTPFETLLYLVEHPGRVVSKDELLDAVWPKRVVDEANVSQTVFTLRKTLAAAGGTLTYIATAPGQGYRFVQPVEVHGHNVAFAGATPLKAAVESADRESPNGESSTRPGRRLPPGLAVAACVLIVLVAGAAVWRLRHPPSASGQRVVVLADFQNLTADPMFNRAVSKAVEIDLDQSPFVTALPPARVADTLDLMAKPKDTPLTTDVASEICTRNAGSAVVDGAIAPIGSDYLVALTVTNCAGDQVIDAEKAQVSGREAVVPALDGLVTRMRGKLGEPQGSIDRFSVPLEREKTASLEALEAYSQADWLELHGSPTEAIPLYQRAIGLDPNFAMAYAGLAAVLYNSHDFQRAADTLAKAYALRDTVGERQRYNIEAHYAEGAQNDTLGAIRAYRAWAQAYPFDNKPWSNLANAENWLGDYQAALEPARRGLALSPQREPSYTVLARDLMHLNRFDEAAAVCAEAVAKGVAGQDIHGLLAELAAARGDQAGIDAQLAWARGKPAERTLLLYAARYAARLGQIGRSEPMYDRLSQISKDQGLVDYTLPFRARELEDLGRPDLARAALARVSPDSNDTDYVFDLAEFGDAHRAEAMLGPNVSDAPQDTLENNIFAPETRAVLALRRGRPLDAVAAMAPTQRYEMRAYDSPYLNGRIDLAAGEATNAAVEFRRIIDNPGIEPTSPLYPLAWLGLARALAAQHDLAGAKKAYEQVFVLWKAADRDLPPLLAAQSEYSRLGR